MHGGERMQRTWVGRVSGALVASLMALGIAPGCDDSESDSGGDPGVDTATGEEGENAEGDDSEGDDSEGPYTEDPPTEGEDAGSEGEPDAEGEPEPPFELAFEEIALEGEPIAITDLLFFEDSNEFLLAEIDGTLTHYALEGDDATIVGQFVVPNLHVNLDCGLIALTFDPEFADNGFIFISHCTSETHSGISRITYDANDLEATAASMVEIFVAGDAQATVPWHNVGALGFEDSGAMWALFGEKNRKENAQNIENHLGAIVRIFPSRVEGEGGYEVPSGFLLEGIEGVAPGLHAIGLRSPWQGFVDSHDRLWIGDVGSSQFEEVNVWTYGTEPNNFGWPMEEGACDGDCPDLIEPLVYWNRESDHPFALEDPDTEPRDSRVVWVALEYMPKDFDPYDGELDGKVLYGDSCTGWVRALELSPDGVLISDRSIGHRADVTAWDHASDGYLYVSTFGACESKFINPGQLFRAVAAE